MKIAFANLPNFLTLARIAAVPGVVALLYFDLFAYQVAAAILFGVAAVTDYFDGHFARMLKQETIYGQFLDPLADKFLVVSSLCMLQHMGRVEPIIVILLICREMAITGLRAVASTEGLIISSSNSAKWKTATQMVAIPFLMVKPGVLGIPLYQIGRVLLFISVGLSLWTGAIYIYDFFKKIVSKARQKPSKRSSHNG